MKDIFLVAKYYGMQHGVEITPCDVICVNLDDGKGSFISQWNIEDKLPQPPMEELEALEPEAMLASISTPNELVM